MGWTKEDDAWWRAACVPRPHGVSRSVDGLAKQSTKKPPNPAPLRSGSAGRSLLDLTRCERIPNCTRQTIPHSAKGVNPGALPAFRIPVEVHHVLPPVVELGVRVTGNVRKMPEPPAMVKTDVAVAPLGAVDPSRLAGQVRVA